MSDRKEELAVVDIRITDPAKVPPRYFLDPAVQQSLREVIRTEVVLNDKKCPPGTEPIYGPLKGSSAAAAAKLALAKSNFGRAIAKDWRTLVLIYAAVVLAGLTIYLIGGF